MSKMNLKSIDIALGDARIVTAASATFNAGEFVALVGPNGAGKTTLLRAMAGLLPHAGGITIGGTPLATMPLAIRAKTIAYLPQGHQLHWSLPVREIVALGRFAHGATDPRRLDAANTASVTRAMAMAEVTALAHRPADALSGGERARVALARVLATEAKVLLADEPTASLDPRHQLGVMATLRNAANAGALVVAVTHDLDHAATFATRILVMEGGRIVADDTPEAALSPAILARVFGIARHGSHWEAAS